VKQREGKGRSDRRRERGARREGREKKKKYRDRDTKKQG